ncbi:hypothetical protein SAMN04244570_2281 [Sporosarcina newyorkensis]|uniref:Uncharacterized protein n=1 Tax=Sporosarcina newyorkensis TaxID=759851 RepID=A0A1T4YEM9_9BACL|nr:hypothetical protein SAMN04244570_2281 [Sporosarcina newyorkensis]
MTVDENRNCPKSHFNLTFWAFFCIKKSFVHLSQSVFTAVEKCAVHGWSVSLGRRFGAELLDNCTVQKGFGSVRQHIDAFFCSLLLYNLKKADTERSFHFQNSLLFLFIQIATRHHLSTAHHEFVGIHPSASQLSSLAFLLLPLLI